MHLKKAKSLIALMFVLYSLNPMLHIGNTTNQHTNCSENPISRASLKILHIWLSLMEKELNSVN